MTRPLAVGVVGLGFGSAHLAAYRHLTDRYTVTALCDTDEARLDAARGWTGAALATTSFDELLDHDLDVIDICTPPTTHVDMARRALELGRHVVCEKPLAGSLAEVDELIAAEAASSGRLMPIFQYRFGDGASRLRALIDAEVVGRPYVASVETFWNRGPSYYESPWRGRVATELGGVCAMHAIHAHDLLLTMMGPVRSVFARTATLVNPIETEDCAAVVLEFESGALATLTATLGSAREISRLRLHFEHLSAESSLAPYDPGAEPWTIEAASPEAAQRIHRALTEFTPGTGLLERQLDEMASAIASGSALPVTVGDARRSIELLTAIYSSAATGEAVDVPIADDHPSYHGWFATAVA